MKKYIRFYSLLAFCIFTVNTTFAFTHADTLRGSNGRGRAWWDILHYDLNVRFDTVSRSITGKNTITLRVVAQPIDSMQIDLQEPLKINNVMWGKKKLSFVKEGNAWWIKNDFSKWETGSDQQVTIEYSGTPRVAVNAPWDGGFTWTHDTTGKLWMAISCQGLGASIWWPCKDAQWDEPDSGMDLHYEMPTNMAVVANGRLISEEKIADNYKAWHWQVKNPINNYDATFYAGDYVHWHDTLDGEKGKLDLDFWVLRYNEERARKQFAVVKQMIHCFEYWMGPYPFYEDGYKLVDAPYLGMEHQSAVAYGNKYKMGYLGLDRSASGYGMDFDYIIVHESGHEWFGNNITSKDIADMWVHESITTYSETLFMECLLGKEKAQKYCRGERMNIENDKPIIGIYGVNEEGSEDMYDKGANMMNMIRTMTNDDEKFRMMLRGLSKEFYHQTVTTQQIEDYIATNTGLELHAFFDQYLRTANIPQVSYYLKDSVLHYKFDNTVTGLMLHIPISSGDESGVISPTTEWQTIPWKSERITINNNYLVKSKKQEP